jgi:hypothetical protein
VNRLDDGHQRVPGIAGAVMDISSAPTRQSAMATVT